MKFVLIFSIWDFAKKNQHSLIATVLHCKTLNFASDELCANTNLRLCLKLLIFYFLFET